MVGLTINGVSQSQTLDGTKDYDYVTITNGGILYITPYNDTGTTGTLILNVLGDVNIDSISSINGEGGGYLGGASVGAISYGNGGTGTGAGSNGGWGDSNGGGGGGGGASYGTTGGAGGHGGKHPTNGDGGTPGSVYGSSSDTTIYMGSGGGGGGGGAANGGAAGGAGGAKLIINAENIYIYGTLNFNGSAGGVGGSGYSFGGGGGGGASGGGIILNGTTVNLTNAKIYAAGGAGGGGGDGASGGGNYDGGGGAAGGGGRFKVFGINIITTGATITAGTVYYEIVTTTGSVSFTSSPSVARIWIDDVDQSVNTPSTISGLTPEGHTYKLVSGIYTATGTFTVTTGMTTDVSVTIAVAATNITSNTNTCVGTCQVTVTTTWANNGNTSVTFRPAITIDTVPVQAATDITIAASGTSAPIEIVTPILSIGTHQICPYPV